MFVLVGREAWSRRAGAAAAGGASKARSHSVSEYLPTREAFVERFEELMAVKLEERGAGNRRALHDSFRFFDRKGTGKASPAPGGGARPAPPSLL